MEYPNLATNALPAEDQDAANQVQILLLNLTSLVERFEASLDLIDRCHFEREAARTEHNLSNVGSPSDFRKFMAATKRYGLWMSFAERDAVLTTWDFHTTMANIRKSLDNCKSLNELVRRPSLEAVLKNLSAAFPDRRFARHAAAHQADMRKSPKEIKRHSIDGKVELPGLLTTSEATTSTSILNTTLADGTVISTYLGEIIEAKVNREALASLRSLAEQMFECFKPAQEALKEVILNRWRANQAGRNSD